MSDPAAIADRLYRYNAEPASPAWRRQLPTRDAVGGMLGLAQHGRGMQASAALESSRAGGAWLRWHAGRRARAGEPTFKLYLSPEPAALAECLRAALEELDRGVAAGCKVGADLPNILRPDRLVIYFRRRSEAFAAGRRLARELRGIRAQGVPFSGDLGGNGLVSWGMDPSAGVSWRRWVARRAGSALAAARAGGLRWPAATKLVALQASFSGIVPYYWTPATGAWGRDD